MSSDHTVVNHADTILEHESKRDSRASQSDYQCTFSNLCEDYIQWIVSHCFKRLPSFEGHLASSWNWRTCVSSLLWHPQDLLQALKTPKPVIKTYARSSFIKKVKTDALLTSVWGLSWAGQPARPLPQARDSWGSESPPLKWAQTDVHGPGYRTAADHTSFHTWPLPDPTNPLHGHNRCLLIPTKRTRRWWKMK